MSKTGHRARIVNQIERAIEDGHVDGFHLALAIGVAQSPSLDLNALTDRGETLLTLAGRLLDAPTVPYGVSNTVHPQWSTTTRPS